MKKLSSPENQPETTEKFSRTCTVDMSDQITFKATNKVLSCVEELRKRNKGNRTNHWNGTTASSRRGSVV